MESMTKDGINSNLEGGTWSRRGGRGGGGRCILDILIAQGRTIFICNHFFGGGPGGGGGVNFLL